MREKISCTKCYETLDVTDLVDDYVDADEDNTINVVKCYKCGTKNAIYFTLDVSFFGREADQDDLDNYYFGEDGK